MNKKIKVVGSCVMGIRTNSKGEKEFFDEPVKKPTYKIIKYIFIGLIMIALLILANKRDAKLMELCPNHELQTLEECK